MLSKLMLGDIFYNILVKSGNCFKSICNLFKRKSEYRYTPVHLMRTEIEIETLLDESDDIPQARFIPQSPKKTRQDVLETLNAIDSCGNVTSFDITNNMSSMSSMNESGFYSAGESDDEDAIFRVLEEDDTVIDFFHNTNVL
tara:strand:- start:315 stop:740 length:426 start_codon:yes stop_codon:yes gene_type:complete